MKYLIALLLVLCCASAFAQMPPPGPVVTNPTGKEYLGIVNSAPGTSIQLNTIATFVGGGGGGGSLVIGTTPISGGSNGAFLNDNGGVLGQVGTTGGGSVVLSSSPVLTTPDLGTPSAVTLTNGTGLPVTGLTGLGSGVVTSLATNTDTNGGIALYGTAGTVVNGTSCVIGSTCSVTITSFPISGLTGAGSGVLSAMANGVNASSGLLTYGIIGTSGASVPLLNQGNTWSGGTQTINSVNILGGSITGLSAPVNPTDAATKMYVDNSAVGLTTHTPVVLATTAALAANTYNNGSSGVGATLTANANGNLVIDGTTNPATTTRVLVKNEGTPANNGIYTVTTTGGVSQAWVLTRATDADTPGTLDPTKIGFGTYVLVTGGSTNLNSSWTVNSTVTTIGSSSINWAQFTAGFSGVASIGGQAGVIGIDSTLHFTGSNLGVAGVVNGTTLISSGTSGDILSNNAGVLGQVGTTGSGSVVLATSATLTTPNLGTPSAVTLTNATGLPISTGVSGLGTGVATALGNAVNTSGGFATYGAPGANTDIITNSSGIFAGSSNLTWTQTGGLVALNTSGFAPTITTNGTAVVGAGPSSGAQLAGQGTACDSALDNRSVTNVVCVQANSSNVGIGTTNPSGTLDIEPQSGTATACLNGSLNCTQLFPIIYKCTGSDTAALNTLIASGVHQVIISGACAVSTLNQFPTNFAFGGQDPISDSLSTISATGDVITLSNGDRISNLQMTSSTTRTGGAFIRIGGGTSGTNVQAVWIDSLRLNNYYDGIHINNAQWIRISNIFASASGSHDCFLIDGASGSQQPWNTDIVVTNALCDNGAAGIEDKADGDVTFVRFSNFGQTYGILIDPSGAAASGNNVQYFTCSACIVDSNSQDGVRLFPTSGAGVYGFRYVDGWIASNSEWGLGLLTDTGNGSAITTADIVNNTILGNTFYGIVLDDNSAVSNVQIVNNGISANGVGHSGGGIYVGVGSNVFRVIGNRIGFANEGGVNNLSVVCSGSASPSEVIATNNDMSGQGSSCAWTLPVKANNINF